MKYLIVVAHPDDEVLGAGATIDKLTKDGNSVDVCIMSTAAGARTYRPSDDELKSNIGMSMEMLGVKRIYEGDFPNIQMNNVPHIELVQFIERAIIDSEAQVVITHHPSDVNNDHMHTSLACQAAIRLFQRRTDVIALKEFWFMEVLSSTEWSVNSAIKQFKPNTFIEVGKNGVERKIRALKQYKNVMRPYPHPRSEEAIEGLAAYRGAQGGCNYAEAFECAFRRI